MTHKIYIYWIFLVTCSFLIAQKKDIPFSKEYFPDKKEQFKEAYKMLEKGNDLFEQGNKIGYVKSLRGVPNYKQALPFFLKACAFNPDNSELNYKIGKCLIEGIGIPNRRDALKYLKYAYELNPNVSPDIIYLIAQAYHLNMKWDEAINEYTRYLRVLPVDAPISLKEEINKKIEQCKLGKKMTEHPARVFIENLGSTVNTQYAEYGPVITADGSTLMFTSRRPNTTCGKIDEVIGDYYEDIYVSEKTGKDFGLPKNMPEPINTCSHDAVVALSPDGQKLILYKGDEGGGDLYISTITKEGWSKPKPLGKKYINTQYHESHASFSPDMRAIYFVSNRPDGFGEHDIWISYFDQKKEDWGPPQNLGPTINTKEDEVACFIMADGKTLYFSSTGHPGIGGYDIFVARYENGVWSEPQNVGYPINTPDDDVFFVITGSGRYGYYSSVREGGYGEKDIYRIIFLGPEKPLIPSKEEILLAYNAQPVQQKISEPRLNVAISNVTLFKGTVLDEKTKQPVEAKIELYDNVTSTKVNEFTSNPSNGKFLVILQAGMNYGLSISAPGYLFHSENFDIPKEAAYKEVNKTIYLKKIEPGATIILRNIFFDYDKADLRPESQIELDRVYDLLVKNPTLKIELSGHTDDRGSDEYNMKLSQKRAESAMKYLVSKGISQDRIVAVGYGETKPIVPNDSEENRQLNRRVELKVLAK